MARHRISTTGTSSVFWAPLRFIQWSSRRRSLWQSHGVARKRLQLERAWKRQSQRITELQSRRGADLTGHRRKRLARPMLRLQQTRPVTRITKAANQYEAQRVARAGDARRIWKGDREFWIAWTSLRRLMAQERRYRLRNADLRRAIQRWEAGGRRGARPHGMVRWDWILRQEAAKVRRFRARSKRIEAMQPRRARRASNREMERIDAGLFVVGLSAPRPSTA